MTAILSIHDAMLDQLNLLRHSTPDLYFATRERDTKNRLSEGYWFTGNEHYLQTTFWTGRDWKEKVYNIGFCVLSDGRSYIELAAQDNASTAQALVAITEELGGFVQMGRKAKWQKHYDGRDYLANLRTFISETKPAIEKVLSRWPNAGIAGIDALKFGQRFRKVISAREQQLDPRLPGKLARVCFNKHGWRYPSGPEGKSQSADSYEHRQGFGHEEWLFDFSKTINGYKYGFVEPLRVESGAHFKKEYDLTLFTRTRDGRLLAVATIRNIYCIDEEESAQIYGIYRMQGWIAEMEDDVIREGGTWRSFLSEDPSVLFNFRFLPEDVETLDLRQINPSHPNIRGHRINLRELRVPLTFVDPAVPPQGGPKFRSAESRTRLETASSTIYDPVHEIMLQKLYKFLHRQASYRDIKYEHDYVDLKALTSQDNWHFFEIKTASPRLCVRQALGQIMEYAYYPTENKCSKLFIVGPEPVDDDTALYLQHLRATFSIPVFYRSFDRVHVVLGDPC